MTVSRPPAAGHSEDRRRIEEDEVERLLLQQLEHFDAVGGYLWSVAEAL